MIKLKKRLILFLILIFSQLLFSQIPETNIYLEQKLLLLNNGFSNLYERNIEDHLLLKENKQGNKFGFDLIGGYKNSASGYYSTYNDETHFLFSPYLSSRFHKNLTFRIRLNIENIKDHYVDVHKTYWSDNFAGMRGGVEIAVLNYSNKNFSVKFGRDYFIPGFTFYENLLFSKYNYSYDQLKLAYRNKYLELSTYYLDLNDMKYDGILFQRHLNGHRLSFNLFDKGYLAINEVMLYGGEDRQMNFMLLNPFLIYYVYQKNVRNFESNSLISLELFYQYKRLFFFSEFLLDDFQIDKEVPGDLEPNEFGYNLTFGIKEILPHLNWSINHTKVANRTYNAPIKYYEKYIYKNYPIGHFLGNNFWELKSTVGYYTDKLSGEMKFYYREFGDEALYGEFNKDYLNYTIKQGYSEDFPFGEIRKQAGIETTYFYNLNKNIIFNLRLSYWFKKAFLKDNFNYGFNLVFHY